jgi:hypothetical protein
MRKRLESKIKQYDRMERLNVRVKGLAPKGLVHSRGSYRENLIRKRGIQAKVEICGGCGD